MGLFGGGNSSSSTSNTQITQDNRIAAAQDSTNLANSGGTINGSVNLLDGGAITKSFDFANAIAEGAANTAAASIGANQATMTTAMQAVQSAYANENASLSDAYTNAKAGEQKIMVAGALLIGAIVAIKVFGKS